MEWKLQTDLIKSDFSLLLRNYQKLEFCVTSFWFYYRGLWWSSCHAILTFFLLYVFLVSIFSGRDLFQVTGIDASCALHIICFHFITLEQVTLYPACCTWVIALLASPYSFLFHTCFCLLLDKFNNLVYISIQFELHWPVQG